MINHTKKVGMDVTKKKVLVQFLVLLLVIGCCAMPAFADETDVSTSIMIDNKTKLPEMHWDVFSYEELIIMRENLNAYIKELERQYAIENGNRIITLNDAAFTKVRNLPLKRKSSVLSRKHRKPQNCCGVLRMKPLPKYLPRA